MLVCDFDFSENVQMLLSEEKQRILLLERVSSYFYLSASKILRAEQLEPHGGTALPLQTGHSFCKKGEDFFSFLFFVFNLPSGG